MIMGLSNQIQLITILPSSHMFSSSSRFTLQPDLWHMTLDTTLRSHLQGSDDLPIFTLSTPQVRHHLNNLESYYDLVAAYSESRTMSRKSVLARHSARVGDNAGYCP
jgi:hypothetical protein